MRYPVLQPESGFSFDIGAFLRGGRARHYVVDGRAPAAPAPEPPVNPQQFGEALLGFLQQTAPEGVVDVLEAPRPGKCLACVLGKGMSAALFRNR